LALVVFLYQKGYAITRQVKLDGLEGEKLKEAEKLNDDYDRGVLQWYSSIVDSLAAKGIEFEGVPI
jgi:hypothetical protein